LELKPIKTKTIYVIRIFTIVLILSTSLYGWAQDDYLPTTITRNNAYSLDFFKKTTNNRENIAVSPFGISNCLAMLYIGSEGKTQENIATKMNFITPFGVLSSYKQLTKRYQIFKNNDINLLIGNALWIGNNKDIQKKYKNLLKVNFSATVNDIDFKDNSENGIKQINRWVKKASNFNLLTMVNQDEIDPKDELVYMNYVFFRGTWDNAFNEQLTSKEDFFLADSTKKKVDFMHQTAYLRYNENNIFQIIELPYTGKNISMIILLPKNENLLDSLEKSLNQVNYDFWTGELYTKLVNLALPKFRIEYPYSMAYLKNDNGIEIAFGEKPEFPRISNSPILLSKIFQKTVVQINENENNSFAEVFDYQNHNNKKDNSFITMNANHPFIFIIRDNLNNNILMIGKVNDPNFNNLSIDYNN